MKILSIEIENNRAIKCFNLELNGKNLEVAGETGTGKTTTVNALWDILEKRGDSLTHGERKGSVKIELGDGEKSIFAKRVNTKKSSTITLTTDKGQTLNIKDFKQMVSELSINPHKIMDMKPMEQTKTLLKAADLGDVDLDKMDEDIAEAEQRRLDLHRKVELLQPGERPEKAEAVDVTQLIYDRDVMVEANNSNQQKRDMLNTLKTDSDILGEKLLAAASNIKTLEQKLEEARKERDEIEADSNKLADRISEGEQHCDALEDHDLTEITEQISNAQETNNKANAWSAWKINEKKHEDATAEHSDADQDVKQLRADKASALDNAKWPIEGLNVEEGNVIYNGCLLENLGESEQMLVCAALAIADIKAHEIKVVRIDGVESMSADDFKRLQKLFNDEGIQVLSTRVIRGDAEPQEIVIVDGLFGDEN